MNMNKKMLKKLLPYFVEFSKDESILFKKYLEDYVVRESNQWLIIMIIYNESIFLTNDGHQKVQTLDNYRILQPKDKRKSIIISDFLLL